MQFEVFVLGSIVVSITACPAGDRGSIPHLEGVFNIIQIQKIYKIKALN